MIKGRKPVCALNLLAGEQHTDGLISNNEENNSKLKVPNQVVVGNKCNHNKNDLKFASFPETDRRRPHVIEEAKRRIKPYISSKNVFTKNIFTHHDSTKGGRKRRTEALESVCTKVLFSLIHDCNLVNMQYGQYFYNNNTFLNYDLSKLQKVTGCSMIRVKRAISVLKFLDLITVVSIPHRLDDGYIHDKTIITISPEVFNLLDVSLEFLADKRKASIRYQNRSNKMRDKMEKLKDDPIKPDGKKPFTSSYKYNPYQDRDVLITAGRFIREDGMDLRDAVKHACLQLGRSPPDH